MRYLLIIYDNGSHIHTFPQGAAYIAAALERAAHRVHIYSQDVERWADQHLTRHLNQVHYDVVGLGFVAGYYQYHKAKKISEAVDKSKNRKRFDYILGGHGPAGAPDYFKEVMGADRVYVGEAEEELTGKEYPNIDDLPRPAYDKFPMQYYRLIRFPCAEPHDFCLQILTGRGCKWHCNFCFRMDKGFRPRSAELVIEEIEYLWRVYGINYFQFSDELFMSSASRAVLFSEALIKANLGPRFKWDCNGRLNFALPEVLAVMKRAGCQYINYGIESLDQRVLNHMKKGLTVDEIEKGVKATREAGISQGLNIIWGNIGDTRDTLQKAVAFLLREDQNPKELRTIRPVTPYPGCPLYEEAIKNKLLSGPADFYERKHVNSDLLTVNFTDMSDDEFHLALMKANVRLIHAYYGRKAKDMAHKARMFYAFKDAKFRGFRDV